MSERFTHRPRRTLLGNRLAVVLGVLAAISSIVVAIAAYSLSPIAETAPMPHTGDAADDPAIWIHPTDPTLSTIIGTDKQGGLAVYALDGRQLQYLSIGNINNVDLRYNVPLGGRRVALVAATNRTNNTVVVYRVNPDTRLLEDVAGAVIKSANTAYGTCMYHSPTSGKYYVFVTSYGGRVEQWELFDNEGGRIEGKLVRNFSDSSVTEGCVADDVQGRLYLSQESVGIWRYGAEPNAGTTRVKVDSVSTKGRLRADVEGLTIYYTNSSNGYLIASSQGNSTFAVYERSGSNAYIGSFTVDASSSVDGVTSTDGIDVTNFPLNAQFPRGMFVAQDNTNDGANQNFKLVPWDSIAKAFSPDLRIDTTWDPRTVGAGNSPMPTPLPTWTPTPTPTPTLTPTAPPTPPATNTATTTPVETTTSTTTAIASETATYTPTSTSTSTATSTPTVTATNTNTPTASEAATATNTPTAGATDTATASSTATALPWPMSSNTPTSTDTPFPSATTVSTPVLSPSQPPIGTLLSTSTPSPTAESPNSANTNDLFIPIARALPE